ncbi:hypothetical protein LO762_12345 [Actinocorallia sp. API 0066]|uniref:hypothetical protein n=1 Tax=Actinocorallia sp. API 0066 TaxID=2896846 RepID=UPI001E38E206|nr:hypothetical protein [Actinocorallia sp. API 0066]MCD0449975.1 hypothetical protein [Actinocorallia sp. API 0066]
MAEVREPVGRRRSAIDVGVALLIGVAATYGSAVVMCLFTPYAAVPYAGVMCVVGLYFVLGRLDDGRSLPLMLTCVFALFLAVSAALVSAPHLYLSAVGRPVPAIHVWEWRELPNPGGGEPLRLPEMRTELPDGTLVDDEDLTWASDGDTVTAYADPNGWLTPSTLTGRSERQAATSTHVLFGLYGVTAFWLARRRARGAEPVQSAVT